MKCYVTAAVLSSVLLAACSNGETSKTDGSKAMDVSAAAYTVQDAAKLQQRIAALNAELANSYQQMKRQNAYAFSDSSALNADDLTTLNVQAVSATALKPVKENYCTVMNGYFNELYRLGHFNLNLLDGIAMANAPKTGLRQQFENADTFYRFILEQHTSYKQAQQLMGFGCNLRAALTP